jgi:transposase InsO family protein
VRDVCREHEIAETLTLGTDDGSAFTARKFRQVLSGPGTAHRRGRYRHPESQAFIESWFAKLKEHCIWRHEFETLDQAREVIAAHIDRYQDRPHQASTTERGTRPGNLGRRPGCNYQERPPEVSTPPGSSPVGTLLSGEVIVAPGSLKPQRELVGNFEFAADV